MWIAVGYTRSKEKITRYMYWCVELHHLQEQAERVLQCAYGPCVGHCILQNLELVMHGWLAAEEICWLRISAPPLEGTLSHPSPACLQNKGSRHSGHRFPKTWRAPVAICRSGDDGRIAGWGRPRGVEKAVERCSGGNRCQREEAVVPHECVINCVFSN